MAQKEHVLVAKPELQEHCEPFLYIYFLSTTHDVHAKVFREYPKEQLKNLLKKHTHTHLSDLSGWYMPLVTWQSNVLQKWNYSLYPVTHSHWLITCWEQMKQQYRATWAYQQLWPELLGKAGGLKGRERKKACYHREDVGGGSCSICALNEDIIPALDWHLCMCRGGSNKIQWAAVLPQNTGGPVPLAQQNHCLSCQDFEKALCAHCLHRPGTWAKSVWWGG